MMYYGCYWGCDWWPLLFLKNILRPKRFLTRFTYNNTWQWTKWSERPFVRDGIQCWPGRYKTFATRLNKKYPLRMKAQEGYAGHGYIPDGKKIITDTMTSLRYYWGAPPVVREPFHHSTACPTHNMLSTRLMDASHAAFNVGWHYDTPNLVQLMILLNDVTEKDSHMQYARGEHRRLRTNLTKWDYYYSDEYAEKHFDIVKCIGPKGTAYLFDTNAPHRFFMVKNSLRAMVKVGYTPGNAILFP